MSAPKSSLTVQLLEDRTVPSGPRTYDGTNNNTAHPQWGSTDERLIRVAPPAYADQIDDPAGTNRPSPRLISNVLADQGDNDATSDRLLSAMIYAWGQFIDHDLGLTPTAGTEIINIPVPAGDPYFDPNNTGTQVIRTTRSVFDALTGTSPGNPRQQINTVTAWIDGSMIYGSDAVTAGKLRTMQGGLLKMSAGGLLPYNNAATFPTGTLPMANDAHRVPNDELFAAGDVRANENVELTALHTLFVREHNRIARQLAQQQPNLTDEQLYQEARARVIGELEAITYNHWLPALLGSATPGPYRGYDPQANPQLANEFSTAAFRFGHSLLGDDVEFLDNNGRETREGVSLAEAFSNPELLAQEGIDSLLKYLSSDPASEMDPLVVGSVRNFLFGPPGAGGFDLASLNIARGRDHGLADYNTTRAAYGLPRVQTFRDITSNPDVQAKLQQLYGTVNNIDLWVGVLAESHLPSSTMGPTGARIVGEQFGRLRAADSHWYQRTFSGALLGELDRTTLTDVMRRNTGLTNLQRDAFFFRADVSGVAFTDANGNGRRDQGERPLAGETVRLTNADGVVAETRTDALGRYHFGVLDGLRTGDYQVQLARAPQVQRPATVTRGDVNLTGLDLGLPRSGRREMAGLDLHGIFVDDSDALGTRPGRGR